MEERGTKIKLFIISGLSGSGKSEAIRALEDCGYFCVDNLPTSLLSKFLDLCEASGISRVAAVMDVREGSFLEGYRRIFTDVVDAGQSLEVLYLEASTDVLLRRFKGTRRKHPLAVCGCSLAEAIHKERIALTGLREMADVIVDTSELNVHQLKKVIQGYVAPESTSNEMVISLTSFGFKYGLPREADIVLDVRFLPNPYFVDELRPFAGTDPRVANYVLSMVETKEFLSRLTGWLDYVIPLFETEGKPYLTIAIGCTGGRHRSVCLAQELSRHLSSTNRPITVRHRDIDQGL